MRLQCKEPRSDVMVHIWIEQQKTEQLPVQVMFSPFHQGQECMLSKCALHK